MNPNGPRRQQDQAKVRVGSFPFSQHRVGNFADQRQSDGGRIILLHVHKRFDQFALIDANQLPRFALEIPDTDVGQHFQASSRSDSLEGGHHARLRELGRTGDPES